jgi:predicted component of type VI protein secretion system
MILLLEVKSGPSKGKGIRLQPGQSVRVGRTAKSDFVLPVDSHLSGMHFEVSLDDNECRLRDLKSTNGTLLNGQAINETVLRDGDTIVAGETTFRIRMLVGAARGSDSGPPLPTDTTPQLRLLTLLRNRYQPLYANPRKSTSRYMRERKATSWRRSRPTWCGLTRTRCCWPPWSLKVGGRIGACS